MPLCRIDGLGFHRATKKEIRDYLAMSYAGIFPGGDFAPETPEGRWIDRLTDDLSGMIDVLGQMHAARSPSAALGAQLSRIARINGVTRNPPERSTGTVTCSGVAGTPIPAGSRIGNAAHSDAIFETVADAVLEGGVATVAVRSTVVGPVPGDAGDLSIPLTVISGWNSVTNPASVSLGNLGETDAELRTRRAGSVAINSQGIVDGLRAALLQVPDVTEAVVRENPEDTTQVIADGGPLAAHAIQCLVRGGAAAAIAQTIALRRAPGCTTVGAVEEGVVDAQGVSQTIRFDRPDDHAVYVNVRTPAALTADEEASVRDAIVARGLGQLVVNGLTLPGSKISESVAPSDVWTAITALQLTTMPSLRVSGIDIGSSPSPSGDAEIAVPFDAIATWDADNVTFEVDP